MPSKTYIPAPYCPTISASGAEQQVTLYGENMWLRTSRFGQTYAEGYAGHQDLSETIPTKTLTGSITTTKNSTAVFGTGTAFKTELRPGSFVFVSRPGSVTNAPSLLVVEKVLDDSTFVASRAATATVGAGTGYIMPVIFPIGSDRGTAIRGNVIQFPTGHYLGVGDGTFRINGTALTNSLTLSRTPRFALVDTTGTYTQDDVGVAKPSAPITISAVSRVAVTAATNASPIQITAVGHGLATGDHATIGGVLGNTAANGSFIVTVIDANNFTLNGSTGDGAYTSGGYLWPSVMQAGAYNVRVRAKNTTTLGFSQPTDVIEPVTLTANQSIKITFNSAMWADQNAYDIYCTEFQDNGATTIQKKYMGPWYLVKTVKSSELIDGTRTLGTESGTWHVFSYADAEMATATKLLSFDNFAPVDAEFVDLINGIPIYFSCLGKRTSGATNGTSPGPVAVPSKPSNPEAVFLNKAITTAGGDTIVGEFNAKSRIYVLGQNTLQQLILTTLEEEPIAFRSLWNSGFRNPYNVCFVKEYLYGFSTHKIVRSVAGGDDSTIEFEFASDVRELVNSWATGHVLVAYDPKNRAVCFFYSAAETRSGYYVTKVLPFLLDRQIWNPPIILSKTNQDFIVSGVATIDDKLVFLAGGETSGGAITVGTYVFDGGSSDPQSWYLAWNYTDDGEDLNPKTIKGVSAMGRFNAPGTKVDLYGVRAEGQLDFANLQSGASPQHTCTLGSLASSGSVGRKRMQATDWGGFSTYTIRISGSYTGGSASAADRLDEIVLDLDGNNSQT